jgi:transcriptional regulator with PAS, ATPase and Fis domain
MPRSDARLDIRCNVDLPVSLIFDKNGGKGVTETKSRFTSLSLSGGFIDYVSPTTQNKIVSMKYDLPRHGEFEILGEVIRVEKGGVAAKFYNVNRDAKLKLWDYIKDNLPEESACPYCGHEHSQRMRRCDKCGWSLNFHTQDYIVEHEKEAFVKRLVAKSKEFSIEDIYKILNYVDVEILGIGKNLEINEEFVGSSKDMLNVFSMIRKVSSTDIPVLVTGESGTGKELTARAIHERSQRRNKPFVPINCAAITDNLLDVELFGNDGKPGKFEYADGGTVFLDEIGSLPMDLQTKLLKFLEDKSIKGADGVKTVDVRIVAATDLNLKQAISKGKFGKDLFYRLDAFSINLPPVRARDEDKIILARYFLNKFSKEMNLKKTFATEATDALRSYEWPGNVREVINKVRRAVLMSREMMITPADLDIEVPAAGMETLKSLREVRHSIERRKLIEALSYCNNNISKVARVLGISRPSVYSLKKKYNI